MITAAASTGRAVYHGAARAGPPDSYLSADGPRQHRHHCRLGCRHLDLFRIGGAVLAALALLVFTVNWVGVVIIAVLLAFHELGLHRLRQTQPAAQSA